MRPEALFLPAWRYIRRRWLESLLIILTVGIGAGLVAAILSLVLSFRSDIELQFTTPEFRTIRVQAAAAARLSYTIDRPAVPLPPAAVGGEPLRFGLEDITQAKSLIPGVKLAYPQRYLTLWLREAPEFKINPTDPQSLARSEELEQRYAIPIIATTADYLPANDLYVTKGSNLTADDLAAGRNVAVIGEELARRLFGDQEPLGQQIELKGLSLEVIGVMAEKERANRFAAPIMHRGSKVAVVPFTAKAIPPIGKFDEFTLIAGADAHLPSVIESVRGYCQEAYGERAVVSSSYEDFRRELQQVVRVAAVIGLFGSAALWIAAINILNLMLTRILRRTRARALSKALGASKAVLFGQVLVESLILGLGGGALGVAVAYLGLRVFQTTVGEHVVVAYSGSLAALGIALIASLVFGLYPALQATWAQLAEALRTE